MKRRDFLATSAAATVGSSLLGCGQAETREGVTVATGQTAGAISAETLAPAGDANVPGLLGTAHQTVWGRRGVVAAADYYASLAGVQILMEGGNAIDAIVAASATLNVS